MSLDTDNLFISIRVAFDLYRRAANFRSSGGFLLTYLFFRNSFTSVAYFLRPYSLSNGD